MSNRTADLDLTGATEAFCARLSAEGRSLATIAAYRQGSCPVGPCGGEAGSRDYLQGDYARAPRPGVLHRGGG